MRMHGAGEKMSLTCKWCGKELKCNSDSISQATAISVHLRDEHKIKNKLVPSPEGMTVKIQDEKQFNKERDKYK